MQKIFDFWGRSLHQSWGFLALTVGIIVGCILGVVFRVNYFVNPVWIFVVILIFAVMYIRPRYLTVGMCLIAGMVLAFFRVGVVLSSDMEVRIGVDAGTEELVGEAKNWLAGRIGESLPEREAGLGMSYLLGMKSGIDKELSENLKMVGLAHIVVASGAHLSILVEVARKIFGRISRFSGVLFSAVFILFFMAMVGWTPSILRAGMMAILTLLAWQTGRKIAPLRLIVIVMGLTLILNPLFLTDLGWLLSFASYAGIMLVSPGLTRFFYGEKKPNFVASLVLTTVAATVMMLPLTLYYFGQVSIISVVANLLILPTLPYAMGLTFLTGVIHGVPIVAEAVGAVTEKLLDFHILIVEWLASMEQFLVVVDKYNPVVFWTYAVIVVLMIFGVVRKWGKKRKLL